MRDFIDLWWREPDLNWWHTAFQAAALPTELPRQERGGIIKNILKLQVYFFLVGSFDTTDRTQCIIPSRFHIVCTPETRICICRGKWTARFLSRFSASSWWTICSSWGVDCVFLLDICFTFSLFPIRKRNLGFFSAPIKQSYTLFLWIHISGILTELRGLSSILSIPSNTCLSDTFAVRSLYHVI